MLLFFKSIVDYILPPRNWIESERKKLCCHTTVAIKYYSRMDNFERTEMAIFYGNLDNFRFKSFNITSFILGGAITSVKLRKVSQIWQNSPWFTLFAIHFYINLYHSWSPEVIFAYIIWLHFSHLHNRSYIQSTIRSVRVK
jgi:hypothetical protein